jgi:hypothetical protein
VQLGITIGVLCSLALAQGCEDLREFKTGPQQVFRGEVIGSDADPQSQSFIRKGFASHTQLELHFDPSSTDLVAQTDAGDPSLPITAGKVDTYVCADSKATCAETDRTPGPFVAAPLITIDGLAHDPLSQYTFPGGGRLRNYIFGVRFVSASDDRRTGRDAMLFVSLMESGHMEVRAMAPSVLDPDGQDERWPALFGVFLLSRATLQ